MASRWDPYGEFTTMRELANRLFNDPILRTPAMAAGTGASSPFPFDLYEAGDDIFVRAAIPGINPADIELAVNQGVLTIKGYRALYAGEQEKQATWHVRGLAGGSFQMAVGLPTAVDAGAAEVAYDAGMLAVRLPKAETVKMKRITVTSAQPQLETAVSR